MSYIRGHLALTVHRAKSLPSIHSNMYAELKLAQSHFKSPVVESKTNEPNFEDHTFTLVLDNEPEEIIMISLFSKHTILADHKLSRFALTVSQLTQRAGKRAWFQMVAHDDISKPFGDLDLTIVFTPAPDCVLPSPTSATQTLTPLSAGTSSSSLPTSTLSPLTSLPSVSSSSSSSSSSAAAVAVAVAPSSFTDSPTSPPPLTTHHHHHHHHHHAPPVADSVAQSAGAPIYYEGAPLPSAPAATYYPPSSGAVDPGYMSASATFGSATSGAYAPFPQQYYPPQFQQAQAPYATVNGYVAPPQPYMVPSPQQEPSALQPQVHSPYQEVAYPQPMNGAAPPYSYPPYAAYPPPPPQYAPQ